ncbi:MAG TPA: glucose-6-phosphate isomerase family protein [Candidatus Methanomethylicus sp.]|nr:glucose-6-phosphate isomerase family protein [Candidatus Methanomethylicus sp.]HRU80963.1 glucose-6-phosphate isomerase family protein [Candidatus Methanomethylicus sp.]
MDNLIYQMGPLNVSKDLDVSIDGAILPYTVRTIRDVAPVLLDSDHLSKLAPDTVLYRMYRGAVQSAHRPIFERYHLRFDITILQPLHLGREYNKTLGHSHPDFSPGISYPEAYQVLHGDACFLLQKLKDGVVEEFRVIKASAGDSVLIPPNYGHVTANCGKDPLVMSNLVSTDFASIYSEYVKHRGAAYYMLVDGRLIPNPSYGRLPKPVYAKDRLNIRRSLYLDFVESPGSFSYLSSPSQQIGVHGCIQGVAEEPRQGCQKN